MVFNDLRSGILSMALKNQKVNKMIYFHQNFMKQHYHQNRAFYQKTYFQEG